MVNPAFASERLPVALPIAFQTTAPLGMSAATSARKVGVAAAPEVGPASTVFAVWVRKDKAPAADTVEDKIVPSPASANTPLPVGKVSVGVAALAGAVTVNFPEAVELASAMVPVEVPGIPSTGAVVNAGPAAPVVLFPYIVPPAAFDNEKDNAGVVVEVPTVVVNSGLRLPALKLVTVPNPDNVTTPEATDADMLLGKSSSLIPRMLTVMAIAP